MDELVDFGDISTTSSFQSLLPMQPTSKFGQLGTLGDTVLFDAPFMSNLTQEDREGEEEENDDGQEDGCKDLTPTVGVDVTATPTDVNKKPNNQTAETPISRKRKIRVNIEVERIIVCMKCIFSDIGSQSFA